jgi:hypothetical protein
MGYPNKRRAGQGAEYNVMAGKGLQRRRIRWETAMSRITLDKAIAEKLAGVVGEVELCDESGRTLGYYIAKKPTPTYDELWASCPSTEEELNRIAREETGRPLKEILRDLGAA